MDELMHVGTINAEKYNRSTMRKSSTFPKSVFHLSETEATIIAIPGER
jgi:hypothetical protein